MTTIKADTLKKLMDAKKLLSDGIIEEGDKIIKELAKSSPRDEYNWFICNIVDTISCDTLFVVLEDIGSNFDLSKCQNLRTIINCGIKLNINSKYFDMALDYLTAQGKKEQLEDISKNLFKLNEQPKPEIVIKIANALKKIGSTREANDLMNEACKRGIKDACASVVVGTTKWT
ncbi:DUF1955 domain-containing protein [Sulfolobus acidocaldarius]|uniref:Conserved protein n=4 Tax=Sulfolobus acidocaldarius TaxID=2285 RepID=Q4J8B6_SULAC|nr:DUF1955 domain-containing protein [Sulfolobus acidocaldarius]AAY80965.1 conserved protein [Sulfolobus acidocaldarius DSM 639]AGE71566.1 hypothetical protein SacN8_08030 [Sulfolobus acidocaldarius N8]AGE73839.1 hypothetical protein SacRon12I_08040 [Sulfolobus acidocaldarius Ron12/I]ALU30207.1 hypothetical protein ATY89_09845 [Sulfolobus acidocaldarius]ALU30922.1 hypothetical protein ATZ20_01400 [Sulfolobus acidocaldarius]